MKSKVWDVKEETTYKGVFSLGVASDVGWSAALPTKGVFGGLQFRVGWELLFFVALK